MAIKPCLTLTLGEEGYSMHWQPALKFAFAQIEFNTHNSSSPGKGYAKF